MEPTPTPFAFHQPFAWSTARLLQVRLCAWRVARGAWRAFSQQP
jgi:hypothetical protein